jgi:thiol peroxidase
MAERAGVVFSHGNPLTLLGAELKIGDKAPDAEALNQAARPVKLSSFFDKVLILSTVPSLDTATCDLETRTFNRRAVELGPDVAIVTVSVDLPFAQKRWCGAAGVDKVTTLSDHRDTAVGKAYGVLVKESRLLARAVFVIDRSGVIQYIQFVPEMSHEPDYDAVLAAAKKLV